MSTLWKINWSDFQSRFRRLLQRKFAPTQDTNTKHKKYLFGKCLFTMYETDLSRLYEHHKINRFKIVVRRPLPLAEFVGGRAANGCLTLQCQGEDIGGKVSRRGIYAGNYARTNARGGTANSSSDYLHLSLEGKKKPGRRCCPIKYTALLTSSWRSRCSFPADVLTSLPLALFAISHFAR